MQDLELLRDLHAENTETLTRISELMRVAARNQALIDRIIERMEQKPTVDSSTHYRQWFTEWKTAHPGVRGPAPKAARDYFYTVLDEQAQEELMAKHGSVDQAVSKLATKLNNSLRKS